MSEEISLPPSELPQDAAASAPTAGMQPDEETAPLARQYRGPPADQPPDEDEAPPTTEEEKNDRRALIRKVMRYRALFQSEVEDIDLSALGTRPLEELRDLARDVEFLVSTRRSANAVRGMFIGSVQILETGGPYFGLELEGLTGVVAQSKDLLETVDEAAVKYEGIMEVDPVARIAIQMSQLVLALDSHNRQKKKLATASKPSPPTVSAASVETPAPASAPIITRADFDDL